MMIYDLYDTTASAGPVCTASSCYGNNEWGNLGGGGEANKSLSDKQRM